MIFSEISNTIIICGIIPCSTNECVVRLSLLHDGGVSIRHCVLL